MKAHRYSFDTDACTCGATIVYDYGRNICEVLAEQLAKQGATKAAVNAAWPLPKRAARKPAFVLYD